MACWAWRFALTPPDVKLHGPAAAPSGAEDPPLLLRHSIFTRIYFAIENEFAFFHFKRPGVTLSGRAFFRLLISGADFIGHFLDRIIFLPICNELFLHADLYRHRYPPFLADIHMTSSRSMLIGRKALKFIGDPLLWRRVTVRPVRSPR